jgi:hypothetical protein
MRMHGFSRLDYRRHGMVAVQVTLTLTALLSVTALAVDGGILLAERRHAQAVADAAALAGAIDLFTHYPYNNGYDTSGTAKASALTTAAANGYSNDGVTSIVTVNIPPQSGYFVGDPGYVEVIVQYNQPRGFSNLFGSGPVPVKARAVARGAWVVPKGGVLALDPTAPGAFTDSGQGTLTINGGTLIDDSNNTGTTGAMTVNGGGTVTASGYNVTGTATTSNNSTITGTITTSVPPTPDPYWYLQPPPMPGPGSITKTPLGSGLGFQYDVYPGAFGGSGDPKLPNFGSGDVVYFHQDAQGNGAIYYLVSGGLTSNGATLGMGSNGSGTGPGAVNGGIMFYNAGTGSNDAINIAGSSSGTVSLYGINTTSAFTPYNYIYNGMLIFQARGATEAVQITGNGNFTMEGTFYAPSGTLKLDGQGTTSIIGSNLVADQISISGQGNVTVDYNGYVQPKGRFLGLVE